MADLKQATFTLGTPNTWTDAAGSTFFTLTESVLDAGASGIAVAQGTHTGVVTGEFSGDAITAIALPSTSGPGSGTPAMQDWITCNIGHDFANGYDPHTVTAYESPGGHPWKIPGRRRDRGACEFGCQPTRGLLILLRCWL